MPSQGYDEAECLLCSLLSGSDSSLMLSPATWLDIARAAENHSLLAYLHWQIGRADHSNPPPRLKKQLTNAYFVNAGRDIAFQKAQVTINQALRAQNVDVLWLKGAGIRYAVYPLSLLRVMADLDFIVPEDQVQSALEILADIGFRLGQHDLQLFPMNTLAEQNRAHHYVLKSPEFDSLLVELHIHLLGIQGRELLTDNQLLWLLDNPLIVHTNDGTALCTLNPEAHLLYLCAHNALQHGLYEKKIIRLLDIHLLLQTYDIDWSLVVDKAVDFHWSYAVERVLLYTQSLFGTEVPGSLFERLRLERHPDENSFLVDVLEGERGRIHALSTVLTAYRWPKRASILLNLAFPSRSFMQRRYDIPPGQAIWPFYIKRLLRMLPL